MRAWSSRRATPTTLRRCTGLHSAQASRGPLSGARLSVPSPTSARSAGNRGSSPALGASEQNCRSVAIRAGANSCSATVRASVRARRQERMSDGSSQIRLDGRLSRSPTACLYVDESHSPGWLYIGVLAVLDAEADQLQCHLDRCRGSAGYQRELHYSGISTRQKANVARSWLDLAMRPSAPCVRFHILGVDRKEMRTADFGPSAQRDENIYRRCLRMAPVYSVKALLPPATTVRRIIHDRRTLSASEYLDWHTPYRMRSDGHRVAADGVEFVDSDHNVSAAYRESNFVQLVDVLLGATRDCLDLTTAKRHRVSVAEHWLPLVERLTDDSRRKNRQSSFGYVGRCNVSFFPVPGRSDRACSSDFYVGRTPRLANRGQGQLFD